MSMAFLPSYSSVYDLMKKCLKSLTTPRKVGGISPQYTGMKVLQTQAWGKKKESARKDRVKAY